MTFQPRMQNRIEGFSVIGGLCRREWNGIVADVWDVECAPHAGGYYVSRDPRLFILLDTAAQGDSALRLSTRQSDVPRLPAHQPISYIPADMELWADLVNIRFLRHLDLHFNADAISRRLMEDMDGRELATPRLLFSDERIQSLAQLIAAECRSATPLNDLYGDSLSLALIINTLKLTRIAERKRSKLASWQLRRATDYISENSLRTIRLEELASLTGLSESHFSHAFKASTGVAPHQWQTRLRLEKAKELLLRARQPLTEIAAETGFADQAHFTRVFRKNIGTTPAQWQKAQLR